MSLILFPLGHQHRSFSTEEKSKDLFPGGFEKRVPSTHRFIRSTDNIGKALLTANCRHADLPGKAVSAPFGGLKPQSLTFDFGSLKVKRMAVEKIKNLGIPEMKENELDAICDHINRAYGAPKKSRNPLNFPNFQAFLDFPNKQVRVYLPVPGSTVMDPYCQFSKAVRCVLGAKRDPEISLSEQVTNLSFSNPKLLLEQAKKQKQLDGHPAIAKVYDCVMVPYREKDRTSKAFMYVEDSPYGSLDEFCRIQSKIESKVSEDSRINPTLFLEIFKEMANCVYHLERQGQQHGNIRPENFMVRKVVGQRPEIFLKHFEAVFYKAGFNGSLSFLSPKLLDNMFAPYLKRAVALPTFEGDLAVWQLGCSFYQLHTGELPPWVYLLSSISHLQILLGVLMNFSAKLPEIGSRKTSPEKIPPEGQVSISQAFSESRAEEQLAFFEELKTFNEEFELVSASRLMQLFGQTTAEMQYAHHQFIIGLQNKVKEILEGITPSAKKAFIAHALPDIFALFKMHVEKLSSCWEELRKMPCPKDPLQAIIWTCLRSNLDRKSAASKQPSVIEILTALQAVKF